MSYTLRFTSSMHEEYKKNVADLLQSVTRSLVLVSGLIYSTWMIVTVGGNPRSLGQHIPIAFAVISSCAVVLLLLSRHTLLAQILWQMGLLIAITLAVTTFKTPWIGFFNVLLPLMGALTIGWPAALTASGFILGSFLFWPASLKSSDLILTIMTTSVLSGGLGWMATRTMLTVANWSIFTYQHMLEKMEEARDQQQHLREVETDLIHANRELARLSEYLKALNQIAEEARQAKENFVASVSHELRTPLNMILGFSEVITQSPELYGARLPPALMADIRAIYRNSQHLSQLVDDVLSLSKVDANRVVLNKEWVKLVGIINEAADVMRPLITSKGLSLKIRSLPEVEIFCDETRIRQVIINLLNNAVRFTEKGRITIDANLESQGVAISVNDTGPGIAPEVQSLIFEPFQQASSTTHRDYGGTGLGLSICKRFVEMHDGEMWLESELDVGTTFFFKLPLVSRVPLAIAKAEDAKRWFNPYQEYEPRTRPYKAPDLSPSSRYIVVDMENIVHRMLEHQDINSDIVIAHKPAEVCDALNSGPAQAVIINLPSNEAQLYIDIVYENAQYKTPILNFWMPGDRTAIERMGVQHYLVKPVGHKALVDALRYLDRKVECILVIDDDPEVHQLFDRMLTASKLPYRMLWAMSGEEGLQILRERDVDVLLLDLLMPVMSGYELLDIKNGDPEIAEIPVIVISAEDPDLKTPTSGEMRISQPGGLTTQDLMRCIVKSTQALVPESQVID